MKFLKKENVYIYIATVAICLWLFYTVKSDK